MALRRSRRREKAGQKKEERFSIEQVAAALRAGNGFISKTAKRLKCSESCLRNYLERYPELEDVRDEVEEGLIDLAEDGLVTHIKKKNLDAIKFHLERKGKSRGYVKQTEIAGVDEKPLNLTIVPATGHKDDEED